MREAAVFFACAAFLPLTHAAHPLVTEDTGTQGLGRWQLELMGETSRDRSAGVTTRGALSTAVLAYGVLDNGDLQLGVPRLRQVSDDGVMRTVQKGRMDMSLELKWRFFERGDLSLALMPGFTFPTGDEQRGLGTGRTTYGSLAILSFVPGTWAVHAHAGARRNRNAIDQRTTLRQAAVAATYQARDDLKLIADLSRDTNPDKTRRGSLRYLILGAIYAPSESLDLSVGFKRGSGEASIDRAPLLGVTLRW